MYNINISTEQIRNNTKYLESWGIKNTKNLLHPFLSSMEDVLFYSTKHPDIEIHGVYFRYPVGYVDGKKNVDRLRNEGIGKPGKGFFINGKLTRKVSATETTDVLHTLAFVPCKDSNSAYILESLIHNTLESLGHERLTTISNENGREYKTEFFTGFDNSVIRDLTFSYESYHSNSILYFNSLVNTLCNSKEIGRITYSSEYYQEEASNKILEFYKLLSSKDYKKSAIAAFKFYLMMKPRSGKNLTIFDVLSKIKSYETEVNKKDTPLVVDFISYWPSAFSGAKDDMDMFKFVQSDTSTSIDYVDTNDSGWEERFNELMKTSDIIVRLSSMQSLSREISSHYNTDEDVEGDVINYNDTKCKFIFDSHPADIYIKDESDFGLRTDLSKEVENLFLNEKLVIELSGSDFYAIKTLITDENHYLYDILQEEKDIRNNRLNRKRPIVNLHTLYANTIPNYDNPKLSIEIMDSHSLSRRNDVLFSVNKPDFINEEYYKKSKSSILSDFVKFDRTSNTFKWIDLDGNFTEEVKFIYTEESFHYIESTYYWNWSNVASTISPHSCDNIFWTLPNKLSVFATYNHIANEDILSKGRHKEIICLNHPDYSNPFDVEKKVNKRIEKIGGKGSIVLTVGKMLRGAKAPWDCVIRMDDKVDAKLNIQTNLRSQNTDKENCYVFDPNIWRVSQFKDSIIRSASDGTNESELWKEVEELKLINLYATGDYGSKRLSVNDVTEFALVGELSKTFDNLSFFNKTDDTIEFLSSISVNGNLPTSNKNRDPKSGKVRKSKNTKNSKEEENTDSNKKLRSIEKKFKLISSQLPVLLLLDESNSYDIQTIIDKFPKDLFSSWLNRLGIGTDNMTVDSMKKLILSLFIIEDVNKRIRLTKGRFDSMELTSDEYQKLSIPKSGDVNTSSHTVSSIYSELQDYINDTDILLDISCSSSGEFAYQRAEYLKSIGKTPSDYIYIMDMDFINIKLTLRRLKQLDTGFDIHKNVIDYNKFKEGKLNMKFDAILGNPPFQSDKSQVKLWPKFIVNAYKSLKVGGTLSFIVPSVWTVRPDGQKFKTVVDIFRNNTLLKVTIDDAGIWFDESESFCSFLLKKEANTSNIKTIVSYTSNKGDVSILYDGSVIDRSKGYITEQSILNRVDNIRNKYGKIDFHEDISRSIGKDELFSSGTLKKTPFKNSVKFWYTASQLYYTDKSNVVDDWKLMINFSGYFYSPDDSKYQRIVKGEGNMSGMRSILFETKEEAKNFYSVTSSKLYRYLVESQKTSGYNTYAIHLPKLPSDTPYTDDELYKLFNLSDEEIEYIEDYIKSDN